MTTLAEMLVANVHQNRNRPAIYDREQNFTYEEFAGRVSRAAGLLRSCGVKPGERFGVLALNNFRVCELIFAAAWSGAIAVPINFRLALPEIRHVLDDSGCRLLFVDRAFQGWLREPLLAPWSSGAIMLGALGGETPQPDYDALVRDAAPLPLRPGDEDEETLLLYTGGTSGRGKGVRLSHRNLLATAFQLGAALGARDTDIYLHTAPIFHSADIAGYAYFLPGAGHAFLPKFSGADFLQAVAEYRATATTLPATMVILLLQTPDFERYDLSSLRTLLYGASPLPVEWMKRAMEKMPRTAVHQGYGLTENAMMLTSLSDQSHREALARGDLPRLRSCGRPNVGVTIRIVGEKGDTLPAGQVGEVAARSRNVMLGYLNRDEENREALRDGWLYTGDIGKLDEEGYLYLLDRKKDLIISGGENVYSAEVETVLCQHPAVCEAAVIGVPHPQWVESVMAIVRCFPGAQTTADELIAFCRGRIGGYKIPRQIEFTADFPRNALGKILKKDLRERYRNGSA